MTPLAQDYEKLGLFYLGHELDAQGEVEGLSLYPSRDLLTHGVILGMTGSGKTGLGMALIEEAAMDGVPVVILDPKGDMGNLLLNFPELRAEDFEPWVEDEAARRAGRSRAEEAEAVARQWREGLAQWGQGPERVKALSQKVEMNLFTPGSRQGTPVSVLSSLAAPGSAVVEDPELFGDRVVATVGSLFSLMGESAEVALDPAGVFLGALLGAAWREGQDLTMGEIIRQVQDPPFDKVGVLDLESFFPAAQRTKLALSLNAVLARPGFEVWMEEPTLDLETFLHTAEGKPRVSVLSLAHLDERERMFFVSLFLSELVSWMRRQTGTSSLRMLLYMDEVAGYLPPSAKPASKGPFLTLLKQARAYGVGLVLSTQNPVDLDYKALSNMGTWWLGRLQTEGDLRRVMDGLEGVTASGEELRALEGELAGLQKREFVVKNVHEEGVAKLRVRWVLSYLRGPLTRPQIEKLTEGQKKRWMTHPVSGVEAGGGVASRAEVGAAVPMSKAGSARPVLERAVEELFVPFSGEASGVCYRPALLRQAQVGFSSRKARFEGERKVAEVLALGERGVRWEQSWSPPVGASVLRHDPRQGVSFGELPGYAMGEDFYREEAKQFQDDLYREQRAELLFAPELDEYSQWGEDEGTFRSRLALRAREVRDKEVEKLRDKYASKLASKLRQIERAELTVQKEKDEAQQALLSAGAGILGGLLGGLLGGSRRRGSLNQAGRAYKQRRDVGRAEEKVQILEKEHAEMEEELAEEVVQLEGQFDPLRLTVEREEVSPYKKNIAVQRVALLWCPFRDGEPAWG